MKGHLIYEIWQHSSKIPAGVAARYLRFKQKNLSMGKIRSRFNFTYEITVFFSLLCPIFTTTELRSIVTIIVFTTLYAFHHASGTYILVPGGIVNSSYKRQLITDIRNLKNMECSHYNLNLQ